MKDTCADVPDMATLCDSVVVTSIGICETRLHTAAGAASSGRACRHGQPQPQMLHQASNAVQGLLGTQDRHLSLAEGR